MQGCPRMELSGSTVYKGVSISGNWVAYSSGFEIDIIF